MSVLEIQVFRKSQAQEESGPEEKTCGPEEKTCGPVQSGLYGAVFAGLVFRNNSCNTIKVALIVDLTVRMNTFMNYYSNS